MKKNKPRKLLSIFLMISGIILIIAIIGLFIATSDLDPPGDIGKAEWFDDWFTIEKIDDFTYIIGEPRYWQVNYHYLILGSKRALLFDSGSGKRDIIPVIKSLTSLPVTAAMSHSHFDHIGNHEKFEKIAMADIPCLKKQVKDGSFKPLISQFLLLPRPAFKVTEWWKIGDVVDLGGRKLKVFHVPGHSPDSIALLDSDQNMLFVGDFIYPSMLLAITPGADLKTYLKSARDLRAVLSGKETFYCGHFAPRMGVQALIDLEHGLEKILAGTAEGESEFIFKMYTINKKMTLLTW
ncbi:MAG: MBL fold metallo-hydrolase [bacterium]|nr:MBL fold metallo-hydrolase [bacterium]